jgi:hypothetical protein
MPRGADDRRSGRRSRGLPRPLASAVAAIGVACALPIASAYAQDDVPRAPRIDRTAEPPPARPPGSRPGAAVGENRGELVFELRPEDLVEAAAQAPPSALDTFVRPPNAARLAPLPEERRNALGIDEIVVLGGDWRLPDLGSRWRARQQAAEEAGVPHLTLLPLYDPERPTTFNNSFLLNREFERVGYIDLFRFRFGKRAKPDDE